MDHEWTLRFLQHRVGDYWLLRLIRKWLKVGIIEEGKRVRQEVGAPQGAVMTPRTQKITLNFLM
jgi:RNA-directed DNA polymerase